MKLSCQCGWKVEGDVEEVVAETKLHGVEVHNMEITREQVLEMADAD